MRTSFNKCVLVWIDDNFIKNDYLNTSEDIDKWNEIFGSISKKIYRLLDLELKIITTKSDFDEYFKSIGSVLDTYYYFILDLSIPLNIHDEPKVINGLNIGVALNEKKYDFCYLSSNNSAGSEMRENGLGSIDFHPKVNKDILLPESLSHKILISFRNNISWIDLNILLSHLEQKSNLFHPANYSDGVEMELSIFPYFDKFKDFVDRSELESHRFNKIIFLRSHPYNSKEFEMQAILIMMANVVFSDPDNIVIYYEEFIEYFRENLIVNNDNVFHFIKVRTDNNIDDFRAFYKKVRYKKVFFIIENNEDTERFIEFVDSTHTTIKDFPYINEYDFLLRHKLTQKTLSLLLHSKHTTDNGMKFNELYLDYPELLINPVNLNFMENPKLITKNISDIPEITKSIKMSLDNITISLGRILVSGNPLEKPEDFLRIAQEILEEDENQIVLIKILIFTLDRWLKDSWLFPYGIRIDHYHDETITNNWKKTSFSILRSLAQQISKKNGVIKDLQERKKLLDESLDNEEKNKRLKEINLIYKISDDDTDMEYLEVYSSIELALNVLNSDAMNKIINDDVAVNAETWEEFGYLKWPHTKYPMPWYLNNTLSKFNKHLWIEHENFHFVGVSEKLNSEHRKLNLLIEYYDNSLCFIEKTSKYFPLKMQDFIRQVKVGIENKNIVNDSIFVENFKNFTNTALNISSLFGACIHQPQKSDISKIKKNIHDLASFGHKLSYIRDTQFKNKYIFKVKNVYEYDQEKYLANLRKNIYHLHHNNHRQSNIFLKSMYDQLSPSLIISIKDSKGHEIQRFEEIEIDEKGGYQIDCSSLSNGKYQVIKKVGSKIYPTLNITIKNSNTIFKYNIDLPEVKTISELINNLSKDRLLNRRVVYARETGENMSKQSLYDLTILKANNRTALFQIQNIINNIGQLDMYFNILKFMDAIELYEFMTDTRNKAVEHQKLKINFDYMFESFIYSYESIWLQYQYVVNRIEAGGNDPLNIQPNYIELNIKPSDDNNEKLRINNILSPNIQTKEDLDIFLNSLLEENN